MKRMYRTVLSALVCGALSATTAVASDGLTLRVLHTNDTHSVAAGSDKYTNPCATHEECFGGYGRLSQAIKTIKANHDNVIAVDAGDVWQGSLYFTLGKEDFVERIANTMPWDAVTLGNHEFDLGCEALARHLKRLETPVLAANLVRNPACPLHDAPFEATRVITVRGTPVGIVGLANDHTRHNSSACAHTTFTDRYEAAQQAVDALQKQGVKHIVAVTHFGYDQDMELAKRVKGIDIIVGGHTHTLLGNHPKSEGPYPTLVNRDDGTRTLVVTAFYAARLLGDLTVRFDARGEVQKWDDNLTDMVTRLPSDPAIDAVLEPFKKDIVALQSEPLTRNDNEAPDGQADCRSGPCLSGSLLADAYLAWGKAHGARMALINSGTIRAPMDKGVVTRASILKVLPFQNTALVLEVPGAIVRRALEGGVAQSKGTGPRLLQVAGLRYTAEIGRKTGERIVSAEVRDDKGNWVDLKDEQTYRIVVNNYMARGGDNYAMLRDAKRVVQSEHVDAPLMVEYVKQFDRLTPDLTDRFTLRAD